MSRRGWIGVDGRCVLVGMVHLLPLPGSPRWGGSISAVIDAARRDTEALAEGGCDAVLVENMGDVPYLRGRVEDETIAAMSVAAAAVGEFGLPVGVQVLAGANRSALAVALAAGATFIRVEAFAYAHVADEGILQASAGPLLRARAALGADVAVWADVQKKHAAHAITGDLDLAELARGHAFSGADALIVTGTSTGRRTAQDDIILAQEAELPVAVGSGVTPSDAGQLGALADALIVGTALKVGGDWRAPVDVDRVRAIRAAMG
jgi:membrane complex biogenesis BtpA family protein